METRMLKILAIDDNQDNLTTLKALVREALPKAVILTAQNGHQGIELARAEYPDVILLDIVMPGMDGFEVCRKIKSDDLLHHIPVVFLTALKADRESRIRALDCGAEGFLSKPLDEIELVAQIRAMAKIKMLNQRNVQEKERLADLVVERTIDLEKELAIRRKAEEALQQANRKLQRSQTATLNLLDDLKVEIEEREKSEERYRAIVEDMPNMLCRFKQDGTLSYVNEEYCRYFGQRREDLIGSSFIPFIPEEEREYVKKKFTALSPSNPVVSYEHRVILPGGAVRWHRWTDRAVFDDAGALMEYQSIGEDISEKKQTQEALMRAKEAAEDAARLLRKSETDLKNAQKIANVGSWIWHVQSNRLEWSDQMYQIFCIDKDSFSGDLSEVISRTIHPDDHAAVEKVNQSVIRDKKPMPLEYRIIWPDGTRHVVWAEGGELILDEAGNPAMLTGIVQDITERKKAEEAIKLNESRLESLLRINQHPVEMVQELLEFGLEEAIALTRSKIGYIYYYDETKEEFTLNNWSKEVMQQCTIAEKQTTYQMEKTGIWGEAVRQRRPIVVNDFAAPNKLKKGFPQGHAQLHKYLTIPVFCEGHIVAVVGVANKQDDYDDSDIQLLKLIMDTVWKLVQQKKTEELLRNLSRSLAEAMGLAKMAAWEYDIASETFTFNDAFYVMHGTTATDAGGYRMSARTFAEKYTVPAYAHQMFDTIKQSIESSDPNFELLVDGQLKRQDGTAFWVATWFRVERDASGSAVRLYGVNQEITERKHSEEVLAKKTEDLARSNADLMQFAYVSSHDLQEPLRMVTSYVQLLEKRYKGRLDPEADEFIGYAVEGTKRMQQLINDLLAYSRVGSQSKPFCRVELEAVLEKALHNLETALEESCGSVTHDPLPPIIADETQMVQLFQNLIANGLKFHGEKSPEIHISAMRNDDNWTFSFRDNGIGIEDQYKDKIFVIFQRLHTRKEYPGTGIGLAISKKIVERHGGRIWVESKPGDGSTFYFTVPEKDDRSERKEQAKNG